MKQDPKISQRRRKWALWIAGILLLYGIVGAILLPPIIKHIAVKQLSQQLGRDVSIGKIRIHPFDCSVTVRDLLIKDPDGAPFVSWETVHVNFQLTSLFGKAYTFKTISTTKPTVHVRVNADGTFNFSDILNRFASNAPTATPEPKPSAPSKPLAVRIEHIRVDGFNLSLENHLAMTNASPAPAPVETTTNTAGPAVALLQSITNAISQLAKSTNQLNAMIDSIVVTNGAIHFEDVTTARPAKLDLGEITLVAKGISNDPGAHPAADLSLRWNQNGSIHVATTASFLPLAANIQIDLDRLDFRTLDPYLEPKLDLFILGSRFGLHGAVQVTTAGNGLPEIGFHGDLRLDGLRIVDGVMAEDLLKWDSLRVSGIDVALNPLTAAVKQVALENLYARLVVETNKTINLLNAMRLTNTNAPDTNQTTTAIARTSDATHTVLPKISVDAVVISNSIISFSDYSLSPNVNMRVQQASGVISGISSEELQHANVDLSAAVDGVGPVAITGTINPFSGTLTNQIKISVKDVDLTPTGPYSAKFAGYRIAEGKLNLDLEYQLVGKNLSSKNVITLDRFTFGEQVDSPEATHLPVRLAIALLKDRNGKIILDVPVEGSLDDPKFRIGKVVTRTIMNILEKVALSPFSLLGAAFGGSSEELDHQEFAAGSTVLTPDDTNKLEVLAKALYERPGLQMEIVGSIDPNGDREGLQRAALDREIRSRIWTGLRKSNQATNSVDQVVLSPDDRARWVKKLYGEALADGKLTPQLIAENTNLAVYASAVFPKNKAIKGATQLAHTGAKPSATNDFYRTKLVPPPDPAEALLLATFAVNENDLETLAASRARSVQAYLLQGGKVEAARLFLKESMAGGLRSDGSRVYFQFR